MADRLARAVVWARVPMVAGWIAASSSTRSGPAAGGRTRGDDRTG